MSPHPQVTAEQHSTQQGRWVVSGPRVVIIGAGVVGAALADELSARGWDDITLVDQGELPAPGGSTSHAPGLVFQVNSARMMSELARYTVDKLGAMSNSDGPCYLRVGSIEVATTPERVAELHRRRGWLAASGIESEILDAAATVAAYPLLDPEVVLGGLFNPTDGLVKAVRAVDAQTRRAAGRGVRLLPKTTVQSVSTAAGRVTGVVVTSPGDAEPTELPADIVVCCAGIWGPRIAAMVGMTLPLTPLVHQLAWTTPLPALAGQAATAGGAEAVLPILRHQDQDLYYRERFDAIGVGYYGHRPIPVRPDDIGAPAAGRPMPSVQEFTPGDFTEAWKQTQVLLPATREAELVEGINGLFSFTTDNMPLLGQSGEVEGFWVAEAVWVTHSAGVGRAMAEWLVDGQCSSFDLHECDVNRFEAHQLAPAYVTSRDCQNFVEIYDIIHPLAPPENLRPIRTSPFHARQVELGAFFLEANGWERPQWYAANAQLVAGREIPEPDDWAGRFWSPIVAAEAQVTREAVALYDMTALKRFEVTGGGAAAFLNTLVTADVDRAVGSVTYCLMLDTDGGIRSDVTVARIARDRFQVGGNGALDLDWMRRHLPAAGGTADVQVRDSTPGTCCIGVWGPRARDLVQPLTESDFSNEAFGYFQGRQAYLGTIPVTALRLSYVGELGWELYATADQGQALWDLLWRAGQDLGVIAAGRGAFTSLRLEKGYRSFGADMTFEHDPYEAGLGFAVKKKKLEVGGFVGRDALLTRKDDVHRRLTCLTLDGIVLGKEPVYADGVPVGYVTSAAHGYTIGRGIAYAWLPVELTEPGTRVQIGWFDSLLDAVVTPEPLFDPQMTRIRS
jgi:glycine cleavage system aminomethyltransferase T/glycine/D-amino acid oxidase-like deaminating enzyme